MTNANQIKVNDSNFVIFNAKNWSFAGDKNTWAKLNSDASELTIYRANGTMSDTFDKEFFAFCEQYGAGKIQKNQKLTVSI